MNITVEYATGDDVDGMTEARLDVFGVRTVGVEGGEVPVAEGGGEETCLRGGCGGKSAWVVGGRCGHGLKCEMLQ